MKSVSVFLLAVFALMMSASVSAEQPDCLKSVYHSFESIWYDGNLHEVVVDGIRYQGPISAQKNREFTGSEKSSTRIDILPLSRISFRVDIKAGGTYVEYCVGPDSRIVYLTVIVPNDVVLDLYKEYFKEAIKQRKFHTMPRDYVLPSLLPPLHVN